MKAGFPADSSWDVGVAHSQPHSPSPTVRLLMFSLFSVLSVLSVPPCWVESVIVRLYCLSKSEGSLTTVTVLALLFGDVADSSGITSR